MRQFPPGSPTGPPGALLATERLAPTSTANAHQPWHAKGGVRASHRTAPYRAVETLGEPTEDDLATGKKRSKEEATLDVTVSQCHNRAISFAAWDMAWSLTRVFG